MEIKCKPIGDRESGECSEREMKVITVKKIKRAKRKRTTRKKSSSSESSRSDDAEEFNPYKCMVPEVVEPIECELSDCQILASPEENLYEAVEEERKPEPRWSCKMDELVAAASVPDVPEAVNRAPRLPIDTVGLDGCRNVRKLLREFGFNLVLVEELIEVLDNEHIPVEEEEVLQQDMEDIGRDVMLQEEADDEAEHMATLPEVDLGGEEQQAGEREGNYSPEPQTMAQVSYAPPAIPAVNIGSLQGRLDMGAIPKVDPRVAQTRYRNTPPDTVQRPAEQQTTEPSAVLVNPKEWEQRVLDVVKPHLKQYLTHKEISRTEFKSILKRAVTKIIDSGERKLDPMKIGVFVHSYVIITQKTRSQQQQREHSQGDSD